MAIFQLNLGYPLFTEAKEAVVITGAISRAKLQSNHHHQQTNIQLFTGRMPFLSANQQCQSNEGQNITFHGLAYPKLTWGLPTLSLTTNSSWLPWGRVAMPLTSPMMPVPHYVTSLVICIETGKTVYVRDRQTERERERERERQGWRVNCSSRPCLQASSQWSCLHWAAERSQVYWRTRSTEGLVGPVHTAPATSCVCLRVGLDTPSHTHTHISEWVGVNVPHQYIIGHFRDESFQSITCTGTDNLMRTTKRQNTQNNTESDTTQKVALVNSTTKTLKKLG